MRRQVRGVHQIGQALKDFAAEMPIRAVDETGTIKPLSDGSGDQTVTDIYLRDEFPPRGKVRAKRTGDTPVEVLKERLSKFSDVMEQLEHAHDAVGTVLADDGRSIAEAEGIDPQLCSDWRQILGKIDDDLNVWGRKFQQRYGSKAPQVNVEEDLAGRLTRPDAAAVDADEVYESSYDEWDDHSGGREQRPI